MQNTDNVSIPSPKDLQNPNKREYLSDNIARLFGYCDLGEQRVSFFNQYKNVINQYSVAHLAQRTRLPSCIRFKYWLYSTHKVTTNDDTETTQNNETENITKEIPTSSKHNMEYEREITKRLQIEKNFQLEMRKLDLRRLEINHKYNEKYLKNNTR